MTIELAFGRRKNWLPPDERTNFDDKWHYKPWWKPETWFYPADQDSHYSVGVGWLWLKIRVNGGS